MFLRSKNAAAIWGWFAMPLAAHNLRHGEGFRELDHSNFRPSHTSPDAVNDVVTWDFAGKSDPR